MSPEQAQGKTLTPAGDVYSLACILYEVLTGKLPFEAKSAMDYIQLHVTGKPILLNSRVPGKVFPPLLERVLDRALAKKPEDRFASAADFGAALDCVLRGARDLPARLAPPQTAEAAAPLAMAPPPPGRRIAPPLPAAAPAQPAAPPSAPSRQLPPRAPQKPRSSIALLAGIAIAFLLLGVALTVALMKAMR